MRTQVRIVLLFLLILAPFVNLSVDTLAKAKRLTHFYSAAPLLEKWFACFPSFGDGLHSLLFLLYKKSFNAIPKRNSPLPSFLSSEQNWNDDRRKEYNLTLSEESGIGYR